MGTNNYRRIVIRTYRAYGKPSRHEILVRPLSGKGLPETMNVECSTAIRNKYRSGSCFIVRATVKQRKGGTPFLNTSWQWSYEKVSLSRAQKFFREQHERGR